MMKTQKQNTHTEGSTRNKIIELLSQVEQIEHALCERKLAAFFKRAWNILEPDRKLLFNWHHDLICEYLTACQMRQIKRLIVNMPPRYTKSSLISVAYPSWVWLRRPQERFIFTSYSNSLSTKHSSDRRSLISSLWYQSTWSDRFQLANDQNMKTEFQNNKRGHMIATSMHGSATGKGGDQLVVDDPHDTTRAASELKREADIVAFNQKFTTRLDNKETGVIVVVMQRLHDKDLTGHLLRKSGWEHLCLPARAPTRIAITYPISQRKQVREENDILHPAREDEKALEQAKLALGSAGFQGQYQQDPKPLEGGFFKPEWWKRYRELPAVFNRIVQFWDCAEKPGITNDYSVCATWLQAPAGFYLLDVRRARLTFPDLERACIDQYAKHNPSAIVIEDNSAGTQLIQNLKPKSTLPILAWKVGARSKEVRAAGVQPTVEAGNCYLPESAHWIDEFILEHERFPNGDHDDQVDTTSMALEYLKKEMLQPRVRSL